jgi:hypothetical protein
MLVFVLLPTLCHTQDEGSFSGSLIVNGNFYQKDERIGAANTPQYERQLYGADSWLNLSYTKDGYELGVRFDLFNNSQLLNPNDSYTDQGLGRWYFKKKIQKLGISAGYLYDQIGSGVIFRAFEERPLLIDNALFGIRLTYDLSDDWQIKAFTGKQKRLFESYDSILKGLSLDGYVAGREGSNWSIVPGFGVVGKTLSESQMDALANSLASYTPDDFIAEAPYNSYAFTLYNTLNVGNLSWYIEGAYKTEEVIFDLFADRTLWTGESTIGKYVLEPGSLLYSSLSYSAGKLGLLFEYKRTENFTFRTDPFVTLNRGMINFLPPMNRLNTYRLTARYNPATQELGEQAFQVDLRYAPRKNLSFLVNFSNITNLDNFQLYRELFTEVTLKKPRKWTLIGGVQIQDYNQEIFEGKSGVPPVQTITPYVDYLYKIDRKKSVRLEMQYMNTDEDFGSWVFGLVEFGIAPHWIFELSDMWNVKPKKTDKLHYPTLGVVYSVDANRFSIRYVKQVEGVVCSGGICRLEPAFSGVRLNISSNF